MQRSGAGISSVKVFSSGWIIDHSNRAGWTEHPNSHVCTTMCKQIQIHVLNLNYKDSWGFTVIVICVWDLSEMDLSCFGVCVDSFHNFVSSYLFAYKSNFNALCSGGLRVLNLFLFRNYLNQSQMHLQFWTINFTNMIWSVPKTWIIFVWKADGALRYVRRCYRCALNWKSILLKSTFHCYRICASPHCWNYLRVVITLSKRLRKVSFCRRKH